jgi:hypothetical protein
VQRPKDLLKLTRSFNARYAGTRLRMTLRIASWFLGSTKDRVQICALELIRPHEHVTNGTRRVDEERRRTRYVERVDANRVPDAVLLDRGAILVAQNRKWQLGGALGHALGNLCTSLSKDHAHAEIAFAQAVESGSQLTELPSTVRSPHSSVEHQQETALVAQKVRERPGYAGHRIAKVEFGRDVAEVQRCARARH